MKEVYKQLMADYKFLPIKACMGQIGRSKDELVSPKEALAALADTKAGLIAKVYEGLTSGGLKAPALWTLTT